MNTHLNPNSPLSIGAVARAAGVGIDTIRYYERERLLPPPRRRASGYRDFDVDAVTRLRFIRRAKELGFSLDDIRELLALSADRERGVKGVRERAEVRLDMVEQRLRELRRMQKGLKQLIASCPGHGALAACPILNALSGEEAPR
ncbi:MAG TPA: heavy metal-responsive transcriptional regulator [Rhodanobacteraceae bacterium]|nr:heavy metal-responsive transcriptional regulator [Rhodanobacteraceae bacterium]